MKACNIVILLLLCATYSKAQGNKPFEAFAKIQDSLMVKDYYDKDIKAYHKHLNEFLVSYNKLSANEKDAYKGFLTEDYYNLACTYAQAKDKKNALAYFLRAQYTDYNHLLHDHDMDILRKEPAFIRYLQQLKDQPSDKLALLRKAPKYNMNEKADAPAFTYQPANDPNLAALRAAYNLDSIAGYGNDISQIINLMEWVHYLIPHNGNKGNPPVKNAMALITECKRSKGTLNCRGLGILLNEVYLAEGFKSRYVTCLPKDTTDQDCHVITMVWSTSLKKWLWMDPTFMAYIMNEKGELLSIEEVRDRLINNKPLILNPDANRNHAASQTKSDYLGYYMSKNLYKLECPVNSCYNYETPEQGKTISYITLLPGTAKPAPYSEKSKYGMTTYAGCYTNNPNTFWAEPYIAPQTATDFENAVGRFKEYYNMKQVDSIDNMFANPEMAKSFFDSKLMERLIGKYGKIISYKYMARDEDDTDVGLLKIVYENKEVHMMGISMDRNNRLETFRFATSSSYINDLLAKDR